MFGHDSKPSKIYSFSCGEPSDMTQVEHQLILAHRYRNALVAQERRRREWVASATRRHFPRLVELDELIVQSEAAVTAARAEISAANSTNRKKGGTPEQKAIVKELLARVKSLRAEHKQERERAYGVSVVKAARAEAASAAKKDGDATRIARAVANRDQAVAAWHAAVPAAAALAVDLAKIDEADDARLKRLRSWISNGRRWRGIGRKSLIRTMPGLYSSTYLAVETSMKASRVGGPPEFRRWDGTGKLVVQCVGGMDVATLLGGEDRLGGFSTLPSSLTNNPTWAGNGPRSGRSAEFRFRACTLDGKGFCVTVPRIQVSRPIPEDARVKWMHLLRYRVGPRFCWKLQFVIERANGWPSKCTGAGTVAMDVGWRLLPAGMRVAYWVGEDGQEGELILPAADLERWRKFRAIRSIRDERFNRVRDFLADAIDAGKLPAEGMQHIRLWRACAKLASVVLRWRDARWASVEAKYADVLRVFPAWYSSVGTHGEQIDAVLARGGDDPLVIAEAWRMHDKHLYQYMDDISIRASRWRDQVFRKFALEIAGQYSEICMEDWNVAKARELPEPEEDREGLATFYANIASVGRLREIMEETMAVVPKPTEYSTQECHVCGELSGEPSPEKLIHACAYCGATWDQDANAAKVLLRRIASGAVVA